MKLTIMNDLSFEKYKGGTERFCEFVAKVAREKGIEAQIVIAESYSRSQMFGSDVVLMTNVNAFPTEEIYWIISTFPVFKMEMDYGFCKTRNGMCQTFKCKRTPEEPCDSPFFKTYREILQQVSHIGFLNPFQREKFRQFVGDVVNNSTVHIPFFDYPERFENKNWERIPNSFLFAHRFYREKGIDEAIQIAAAHPEATVFFAGFGDPKYLPMIHNMSNCTYLGNISDREVMITFMNLIQNFISVPVWEDTGPASVVEAELCGMNLLINENNKIHSHHWTSREELVEIINEGREKLFLKLKELVG